MASGLPTLLLVTAKPDEVIFMLHKIIVSTIVTGFLFGYVAFIYAFVHVLVLINQSYLLTLAM
jgi:hypothetical protein